jgi:hypothetical protein
MPTKIGQIEGSSNVLASGVGTIPDGAATVKVTHGLGFVPARIIVTPHTDPVTRGPWVSSFDSDADGLKFTVSVQTAMSGKTLPFSWAALA